MKKILSVVCTMALMLTMFYIPANAVEQVYDTDYGTLTSSGSTYYFYLDVAGTSATTTGESNGSETMTCSMSATTASGVYWGSDSGTKSIEAVVSGHGVISRSTSHCGVSGTSSGLTLMVRS